MVCTYVVVVVDLHHWGVDAGAQTLHLGQRELLVLCGLPRLNSYTHYLKHLITPQKVEPLARWLQGCVHLKIFFKICT